MELFWYGCKGCKTMLNVCSHLRWLGNWLLTRYHTMKSQFMMPMTHQTFSQELKLNLVYLVGGLYTSLDTPELLSTY